MHARTRLRDTAAATAAWPGVLRRLLPRLLPLGALAVALLVAWRMGFLDSVTLANLIRHRAELAAAVAQDLVLALAAYALVYAALVALSFPGATLMTVAGGFLFGGAAGGLVAVVAATAGAVAIFLIARSSLGDLLQRRAGPFVSRMVEGFNRDAFFYLLFLRLTPVFPFWVVNIVPALLNMALWPYVAATALGVVPATFAFAYFGAGLDSVIVAQERANPGCSVTGDCAVDPSALVTPQVLGATLALAAISILPVIIRKWRAAARR